VVLVSVDRRSVSKQIGTRIEDVVIAAFDELEAVEDTDADWHDAVTTSVLEPGDGLLAATTLVERGTPVEIKGASETVSLGADGRWYVKERAHTRLVEASGVYLLVVYVDDEGEDHAVRMLVPASILDEHITTWIRAPDSRNEGRYAQIRWSRVVDPKHVEGGTSC